MYDDDIRALIKVEKYWLLMKVLGFTNIRLGSFEDISMLNDKIKPDFYRKELDKEELSKLGICIITDGNDSDDDTMKSILTDEACNLSYAEPKYDDETEHTICPEMLVEGYVKAYPIDSQAVVVVFGENNITERLNSLTSMYLLSTIHS